MVVTVNSRFLKTAKLFSRSECLSKPGPIPRASGPYGWYFKSIPRDVPTAECGRRDGLTLLYVGIAPKAPPVTGRQARHCAAASGTIFKAMQKAPRCV